MFEEALLESARQSTGKQRTISTAASLLLQTGFLAAFVIVPLLATRAVPDFVPLPAPIWLPHLDNPAPELLPTGTSGGSELFVASRVLTPPSQIKPLDRRPSVEEIGPVQIRNTHIVGSSNISNLIGSGPEPVIPENPATKHPPVSVLEQGVVLTRVQPVYPRIAIVNRIQGPVHLHAVIAANGNLEALRVLDGHPMLARAALDAVRQWRFRPYVLNGKPIEVQTEVIVNFTLN
jgi:protein TonB